LENQQGSAMTVSDLPAARDFAWAIAPISPEQFLSEHFERRHLVIRRGQPDYYRALLNMDDIDRVLTTQVLHGDELQLVSTSQPVPVEDYTLPSGHVDPVRATQHYDDGATIILPALHRRLPALAAYCRALETVFNCDLQTNIYLTPADAQGFKTHYDSHDVLVLQCHGTKTWRIYDSPLALPLRTQAFEPKGYTPGPMIDSFVLEPGDMLYIPRGVAHDAIATDRESLHITTGLLAHRWVDLLAEIVSAAGRADVALRGALPPGYVQDPAVRATMAETAQALLRRVAEGSDTSAMVELFADAFRRRLQPVVPGHFAQAQAVAGLSPGRQAGVRPGLLWTLTETTGEGGAGASVSLQVYDSEISFPAAVAPTLRQALARARFVVGELPGGLDAAGQVVLVRRLVREGVLHLLD